MAGKNKSSGKKSRPKARKRNPADSRGFENQGGNRSVGPFSQSEFIPNPRLRGDPRGGRPLGETRPSVKKAKIIRRIKKAISRNKK